MYTRTSLDVTYTFTVTSLHHYSRTRGPYTTPLERMYPPAWLLVVVALTFTIVARLVIIVSRKDSVSRRRDHKGACHLAVFLGSGKSFTRPPATTLRPYLGGHSSEALTLISTLDFTRYTPRTYLVSDGDPLSATKAIALERLKAASEPSLVSAAFFRSYMTIDRLGFDSLQRTLLANIRSSLSPVLGACIRTYSLSRSLCCVPSSSRSTMSPWPRDYVVTPLKSVLMFFF
jgi:hypothetical protein